MLHLNVYTYYFENVLTYYFYLPNIMSLQNNIFENNDVSYNFLSFII